MLTHDVGYMASISRRRSSRASVRILPEPRWKQPRPSVSDDQPETTRAAQSQEFSGGARSSSTAAEDIAASSLPGITPAAAAGYTAEREAAAAPGGSQLTEIPPIMQELGCNRTTQSRGLVLFGKPELTHAWGCEIFCDAWTQYREQQDDAAADEFLLKELLLAPGEALHFMGYTEAIELLAFGVDEKGGISAVVFVPTDLRPRDDRREEERPGWKADWANCIRMVGIREIDWDATARRQRDAPRLSIQARENRLRVLTNALADTNGVTPRGVKKGLEDLRVTFNMPKSTASHPSDVKRQRRSVRPAVVASVPVVTQVKKKAKKSQPKGQHQSGAASSTRRPDNAVQGPPVFRSAPVQPMTSPTGTSTTSFPELSESEPFRQPARPSTWSHRADPPTSTSRHQEYVTENIAYIKARLEDLAREQTSIARTVAHVQAQVNDVASSMEQFMVRTSDTLREIQLGGGPARGQASNSEMPTWMLPVLQAFAMMQSTSQQRFPFAGQSLPGKQ